MNTAAPGTGGRASYFGEFRLNWRYLAAACVGMGAGYTINNYLNNIFIPPLMAEFGWASSSVALLGAAATLSVLFQPLSGRATDRFGVRAIALFGVLMNAVIFVLMSMMTGAFWMFLALVMLQIALVASTTGAVVYSRLIAQTFDRARGLALASAVCAPSVIGAVIVPFMTRFIDAQGWRAGYQLAAAVSLVAGVIGLLMIPPGGRRRPEPKRIATGGSNAELRTIARDPALRLILAGVALCSLSISLQTTQLKVVMLGAGLNSAQASGLISIYAVGVILGRFLSGAALDALPTHAVAAVALSLPGVGLLILATGTSSPALLIAAMLVLGVSLGAEGDVAAYLVMRYFPIHLYSTVLGFVIGAISFAAGVGGLILSATLRAAGAFTPFLALSGVAALLGGTLFWRLRMFTGAGSMANRAA